MKLVYKESFVERLEHQIKYISQGNPTAAKNFKNELLKRIKVIPKQPLLFRKSIYFNDDSIRDLIIKGYTVVFRINSDLDQIEIFGLVKFQENPTD